MRRTLRSFHCSMPPQAQVARLHYKPLRCYTVILWQDFVKNMNLDGLILNMHGAAVLEDGSHLDSTMLERIRKEFSKIPIFITVDLHAYITENLVKSCDAILAWNTYPHRDMFDIGKKAVEASFKNN